MRRFAGTVVLAVAVLSAGCGGETDPAAIDEAVAEAVAERDAMIAERDARIADLESQLFASTSTTTPAAKDAIAEARVRDALDEQAAIAENFFVMCMGSKGYEVADVDIDYKGGAFTPVGEQTAAYETQDECMEAAQGLLGPPDPLEYGDIPLSDEELMYEAMAYLRDEDRLEWGWGPGTVRDLAAVYCGGPVANAFEPGTEAVQAWMANSIASLPDDAVGRLQRGIREAAFRHGCPEWLDDFEAATR